MSDPVRISNKGGYRGSAQPDESLRDVVGRPKDQSEVAAMIEALKSDPEIDPRQYATFLANMGVSEEQYAPLLNPAPPEAPKKTAGNYNPGNMRTAKKMYEAPTQVLDLPSKGMFYPNGQAQLETKGLTSVEDDILFTPELITQNKVLHAVLESAIIDKTLRPEDMLSCDRNYVLIQLRIEGFGKEYEPGPMGCESCGGVYTPKVDLSLLKVKELKHMPDQDGLFFIELPLSKVKLRFRLLNGKDEIALQSKGMAAIKKVGGLKAKRMWSERYLLQIMEVNGESDKIFIKSFIDAMPLGDSQFFRKHAFEVEPGIDLNYNFTCSHCGHEEEKIVPITPRLFYPDADM